MEEDMVDVKVAVVTNNGGRGILGGLSDRSDHNN